MEENFNIQNDQSEMQTPKTGFFSRLDNFWYHYKWQTVIALFFIFIFTICSFQMCKKESYDMYIMYAGNKEISHTGKDGDIYTEYQLALDGLKKVADDFDGNGKISIIFKDMFLLTGKQISEAEKLEDMEVNYTLINQNKETFLELLRYSEYYLCILSEEIYYEYSSIDGVTMFAPLNEYINNGSNVKTTSDGCAVYLSSTDFSDLPLFEEMPENTVVCLKNTTPVASMFDKKEASEQFDRAEETIKAIINYKSN